MKTILRLIGILLALHTSCAAGGTPKPISFVLGPTHFKAGDAITITHVVATSPDLKVGDTIIVQGTYRLQSRKEALLALFISHPGPVRDAVAPSQTTKIKQEDGSFSLTCEIGAAGAAHVTFYSANGRPFGGVYFGTAQQMADVAKWLFVDYED